MKKLKGLLITVMVVLAALLICQPAQAVEEWQPDMNATVVKDVPTDVANFGGPSVDVKSIEGGNRFEVTLDDVKLTPKGGKALFDADVVRIASGILDAAKPSGNKKVASEYVVEVRPVNGKVVFTIANYAKAAGITVVEHIWGIGKTKGDAMVKYLVLNPESPWVIYETSWGKPDMETLAIGILMCPDGRAVPVKSLSQGKIKQGKHPELTDACK